MIKLLSAIGFLLVASTAKAETLELNTLNTIMLRGEVSDESVKAAEETLIKLDSKRGKKDYPLYLVLDSPGGSIDSGEDFIEFAKTFKNVQTVTIFAASMASAIVEAMPGKRHITENGVLMFHRAKGTVSGQFETGELESRLGLYKRIVRRMEKRNADRMGMSLEFYKAMVKDEFWLTSYEAVASNAADTISSIRCSQALMDQKHEVVQQVFIFQIRLIYSGCPLLKVPEVAPNNEDKALEAYKQLKQGTADKNAL